MQKAQDIPFIIRDLIIINEENILAPIAAGVLPVAIDKSNEINND